MTDNSLWAKISAVQNQLYNVNPHDYLCAVGSVTSDQFDACTKLWGVSDQ